MSTQFETVIYIKSHNPLEDVAQGVFTALGGGEFTAENDPAVGGECFRLASLGFEGTMFANEGDMADEDFEEYTCGLGISSTYFDPELDLEGAESPLAEYYGRMLAFHLDMETATSFYMGPKDGVDQYEIRAFRRNPQFTLDAGPTVQRAYVYERRTVEYDPEAIEQVYDDDEFEDDVDTEDGEIDAPDEDQDAGASESSQEAEAQDSRG